MKLKKILDKIELLPSKEELSYLKKETSVFVKLLQEEIRKQKVNAEVFVGGSFAKGTLAKSDNYDVDIFVRFDWRYNSLSEMLEEIVKEVAKQMKLPFTRLHGSRDYFRIERERLLTFEIIPVSKIKKIREARNVTDLSYFHVNYVKRKMNKKIKREIAIAKIFFKAQRVYGAESYIGGFSGYAIECLIVYYKTFVKMLNSLIKIKFGERIVVDPEKFYKKKEEVFIQLNESKLNNPIILIDPTWKERNVLAALSWESFERFQEAGCSFLKAPSEKFFVLTEVGAEKFRKEARQKKAEFAHLVLETDRQEGDIAGTKMKKFSRYIESELEKFFDVLEHEFSYKGKKNAEVYFAVKPKKEVVKIGPSVRDKINAEKFKKKNKNVFEQNGILHARSRVDFSSKEFLEKFARTEKNRKMKEMGIIGMKVVD